MIRVTFFKGHPTYGEQCVEVGVEAGRPVRRLQLWVWIRVLVVAVDIGEAVWDLF